MIERLRFRKGDVVISRRSGRKWLIAEDNPLWDCLAMVVPTCSSDQHRPQSINVVNLEPLPSGPNPEVADGGAS